RQAKFFDRKANNMRQSLPAEFLRLSQQRPAGIAIGLIGMLEPVRRRDRPVRMPRAALLIARIVDRKEHFLAEFSSFAQHRLDHVGRGVGKARQTRIAIDAKHIVDEEERILNRSAIDGHGVSFRESGYRAIRSCLGGAQSAFWPASTFFTISMKRDSSSTALSISSRWRRRSAMRSWHFSIVTWRCSLRPSPTSSTSIISRMSA